MLQRHEHLGVTALPCTDNVLDRGVAAGITMFSLFQRTPNCRHTLGLLRPSARTSRLISLHFSMSVNTLLALAASMPRWDPKPVYIVTQKQPEPNGTHRECQVPSISEFAT